MLVSYGHYVDMVYRVTVCNSEGTGYVELARINVFEDISALYNSYVALELAGYNVDIDITDAD